MRMVYVTEEYYQSEYLCGRDSALAESFLYYAAKASQKIDHHTYGRLKSGWDVTDDVKICCCELAGIYISAMIKKSRQQAPTATMEIVEHSIQNHSQEKRKKKNSFSHTFAYLSDSGILYQGRYKEER